jgi:hypothetical protein
MDHYLARKKMKINAMWHCGLMVTIFGQVAEAQVTFEGCTDFRGIPVASVADVGVQDVAVATYAPNGAPVIVYNVGALRWLAPPTRMFFYAHECAHHALGHGVSRHPMTAEQEADCWGIRELVRRNLISPADFRAIQNDIARFGRGDWTHLPGPQRASKLGECPLD